jgi:hypothetical protein
MLFFLSLLLFFHFRLAHRPPGNLLCSASVILAGGGSLSTWKPASSSTPTGAAQGVGHFSQSNSASLNPQSGRTHRR